MEDGQDLKELVTVWIAVNITFLINIFSGVSCGYPRIDSGVILLSNTFMYGSKVPFICPSGNSVY